MAEKKVKSHNPGSLNERVARLEGKVTILANMNALEVALLIVTVLIILLRK